ncbi:hypothetical protein TNCV_1050491 [Trichonephila clavipes]|nr:hypothetical protein TNCV_1050491 [Trichonephila clavipes]
MGKGEIGKSKRGMEKHLNIMSTTVVWCPKYRNQMTVDPFYGKHVSQKHNVNCRKQYLFCFGRKQWPPGQKNCPENLNHITACLPPFVEDAKEN